MLKTFLFVGPTLFGSKYDRRKVLFSTGGRFPREKILFKNDESVTSGTEFPENLNPPNAAGVFMETLYEV